MFSGVSARQRAARAPRDPWALHTIVLETKLLATEQRRPWEHDAEFAVTLTVRILADSVTIDWESRTMSGG